MARIITGGHMVKIHKGDCPQLDGKIFAIASDATDALHDYSVAHNDCLIWQIIPVEMTDIMMQGKMLGYNQETKKVVDAPW